MSEAVLTIKPTMTERTTAAARDVLDGRRRGVSAILPFVGPAMIASVAYVDPGNFATNIQAGAKYGYMLLWVVVVANAMAMLFQGLSAKLGIVTGASLAGLCRDHLPRPVSVAMWLVSEIAAMATDVAEFLGAAIGLALLFGLPLMVALALTGIGTYGMLLLQRRGFRPLEYLITGLVGIIGAAYVAELMIAPPAWGPFALGAVLPRLSDDDSVTLAVGIVGATVMPHAIYLHSSLTRRRVPARSDAERRRIIGFSHREVVVALGLAGLVNMAMVAMAASAFHAGHPEVAEIEAAWRTLAPLLGAGAAAIFLTSLLASGFSSSVVGTMAGQEIMRDFVHFSIPLWARRLITMAPTFVVVACGVGVTDALVYSQVVLSMVLPVPMVALVWLSGRRDIMGSFAMSRPTQVAAIAATVVVVALNAILLLQQAGVALPFLG